MNQRISSSSSHRGGARSLSPVSPVQNTATNQTSQFNPKLILSQIAALQSFHYLILGVIFQLNHVLFGTTITLERIFTDEHLDFWSAKGWIDNAAILASSFVGAILLAIIVEKSKKCLDFCVTLFLIHLFLCTAIGGKGIPSTWDWWIIHIMGMIIMVVLGEWFCSKKELSDIPLLAL